MTNSGSDWRREQFRRTLEHWRASNFDPHVVLGIPSGAPQSLIIDSHRRWVTAYHPDRHDGDPLATELTQRLNAARDELSATARRGVQFQPERQRRQAEAQPQRAAQEEEREQQAYVREERRRQEEELDQAVLEAEQLIQDAARKKHRQSQVREQPERVPENQRRKQDKERRRRANKAKRRKQEKARRRRARKAGKRDKKRR